MGKFISLFSLYFGIGSYESIPNQMCYVVLRVVWADVWILVQLCYTLHKFTKFDMLFVLIGKHETLEDKTHMHTH